MIDGGEIRHDLGDPARRQHQGIAAGQDDFPDLGMAADVVERIAIGALRKRGCLAWTYHFAAEAEPAIHGANMDQLEQHPVGITMDDAGDRRMGVVTDRIGALAGLFDQFPDVRDELACDRVVGIFAVDQISDIGRHRDRIARGDAFEIGNIRRRRKATGDQLGGLPQRRSEFWIDPVHASPAGGVHTT